MNTTDLITRQDLHLFKMEIINEFKKLLSSDNSGIQNKKWLRTRDAMKLLSVSHATIQNMRISGALPYSKMDKTYYYAYADIMNRLEENKVTD